MSKYSAESYAPTASISLRPSALSPAGPGVKPQTKALAASRDHVNLAAPATMACGLFFSESRSHQDEL